MKIDMLVGLEKLLDGNGWEVIAFDAGREYECVTLKVQNKQAAEQERKFWESKTLTVEKIAAMGESSPGGSPS